MPGTGGPGPVHAVQIQDGVRTVSGGGGGVCVNVCTEIKDSQMLLTHTMTMWSGECVLCVSYL